MLSLSLEDPISGIIVQEIDGLDPVNATIVFSSIATIPGSQYQSSQRENRNIILKLGLEPNYITASVRDLRKQLQGIFMPKSEISFRFYLDDGSPVDISGRVESFEAPLFTPEPNATISVICFDPDFKAIAPVVITGNTVSTSTETSVVYDGDIETGLTFVLSVNRSLSEFTIYNRLPDNTVRTLDFQAPLVAGDILTISTIPGSKSVILTRSGMTNSLLYAMTPQSNWIQFFKGLNKVRVYATGAAIPYEITYTTRYGGL